MVDGWPSRVKGQWLEREKGARVFTQIFEKKTKIVWLLVAGWFGYGLWTMDKGQWEKGARGGEGGKGQGEKGARVFIRIFEYHLRSKNLQRKI
jgi:hypothetical protein